MLRATIFQNSSPARSARLASSPAQSFACIPCRAIAVRSPFPSAILGKHSKSFLPSRIPNLLMLRFNRSSRPKRSEEHTSELQSRLHLVCRLLLEQKNHLD